MVVLWRTEPVLALHYRYILVSSLSYASLEGAVLQYLEFFRVPHICSYITDFRIVQTVIGCCKNKQIMQLNKATE
jgi:hypothetical protein